MKELLYRLATYAIIGIFLFLTISSAKRESLTFDEIFNLQEGITNVTTQTFPIEPYNPPLIRELAVLPTVFGFTPFHGVPNDRHFLNRLVIIGFGAILLWYVMKTAREYFGHFPSLVSGLMLSLEPTVLAHSHYITPDIGLTLFVFLSYTSFLDVLIAPTLPRFFFLGLFCGLAAASKVSAIPFLLISFLLLFFIKRKTFSLDWHIDHGGSMVFAVLIAGFVVWATYFFRFSPILVKHDNPDRLSNKLLSFAEEKQLGVLKQSIAFLQGTPVPLGAYIGILKNNLLRARQDNDVFHMGTYHESVSLFMMPQIVFVKLPLPFLLLILLGVWGLVFRDRVWMVTQWFTRYRRDRSSQHQHEQDDPVLYRSAPEYKLRFRHEGRIDTEWTYVFVIPVVAVFFTAILFRMTPLVRYVLPAFPFFALIAGSVFAGFRSRWKYGLFVVGIVWMAWGVYRSYPHYIAFTNEFMPSHVRFLYLVDSNLDWGQGLVSLRQYIEKNQPRSVLLSYFGRDDAALYGFVSDKAWGSYKNDEICAFHTIDYPSNAGEPLTVISVTNWRECGYDQQQLYTKDNVRDIVGDSFLIF